MTSQRGKNRNVAHETKSSGSLLFLPRCDVLSASITEQTTAKWKLFVFSINTLKIHFKRFTEFFWGIFGALKTMNRVS